MTKDLIKLKRIELLEIAKKKKIKGFSKLKKAELIKILSKEEAIKSKTKIKIKQKLEKNKTAEKKTVKKKVPNKKNIKVLSKRKKSIKDKKIKDRDFSQELVESTKFYTGGVDSHKEFDSKRLLEESPNIRHHYGENVCVLLVRDPWCVFSYWEISISLWEGARLKCKDSKYREILRVYDVTGLESKNLNSCNSYFDIELAPFIESWYINLKKPGRSYIAEVGLKTDKGEFHAIISSNVAVTPRYGPSDLVDEEWMVVEEDYWKMFALSGGYGTSISSEELQKVLKKKRIETISSSVKAIPGEKR